MPPPHPRTSQSSLPPPQTEGRLLPAQCLEMPASLLRQCLSSRAPSSPRRAGVRSKQDASFLVCLCVCAKWLQPCLILCDPMDCSLLGSSAMGFSRQEYQSGLPVPSPEGLPNPGIKPKHPALGAQSLSHWTTRKFPINILKGILKKVICFKFSK